MTSFANSKFTDPCWSLKLDEIFILQYGLIDEQLATLGNLGQTSCGSPDVRVAHVSLGSYRESTSPTRSSQEDGGERHGREA